MKALLGGCRAPLLLAALAAPVLAAPGDEAGARRVMAGRPEYDTSAAHNFFMGSAYRKLWVTPIDFPVLDLKNFGGGLRAVRQVGSMQSVGLALAGGDGRSYTFRTSDKDPTRILPPDWKDSVPAKLFQDATAANHPGVGFVVPALAEAAGVLHTTPRYVFMPDDPALGEFRSTFLFGEYPWFEAAFIGGSKSLRGYRPTATRARASTWITALPSDGSLQPGNRRPHDQQKGALLPGRSSSGSKRERAEARRYRTPLGAARGPAGSRGFRIALAARTTLRSTGADEVGGGHLHEEHGSAI